MSTSACEVLESVELSGADPASFVARRQAGGKVSSMRTRLTRWVVARIPSEALAQQAGMTYADAMEFFFASTLRPWSQDATRYARLAALFEDATAVSIESKDTDLTFSTTGRRYVVGDGHINMPDGEVYTAPTDPSAVGHIAFDAPANFWGAQVDGIALEFDKGTVAMPALGTTVRFSSACFPLMQGPSASASLG